jgi:TonB family protein
MTERMRPRRWPWILACVVLFVAGFLLGVAGHVAHAIRSFNVPCPPVFSPKEGEVAPMPRGPGIFPPRGLQRPSSVPRPGRLARVRGQVAVLARVEADGNVSRAELMRSSGFCPYDVQALADVRRWKFEPARRMGEAFAVWIPVLVNYVPGPPSPPAPRPFQPRNGENI